MRGDDNQTASQHGRLESEVLAELFRRFARVVKHEASQVLRCDADIDDVVQRVFLRLLGAKPPITARKLSHGYFKRAGRNEAITVLRERATRKVEAGVDPMAFRDPRVGPQQQVEWEQLLEVVGETIANMPPRRGKVAQLVYLEGMSNAEVARELGIRTNGVERHRAAAKEELRQSLISFHAGFRESRWGGKGS